MAEPQSYDVIIAGGGPAGLTMALALVRAVDGIRVALVDRRELVVPRDQRAFALSAGVRRVFDALGVWSKIAADAQPIVSMKITDSGRDDISRPQFLSFEGDIAPGEPFAHMMPNRVLMAALIEALGAQFERLPPGEIDGFSTGPSAAELTLSDGRLLRAPLVIAADGAQSTLRQLGGIGVWAHDYRQMAIVTTIAHSLPHEGVAYQHFRPAGPFASLPLPGNRSSLVWTETVTEARRYASMDEAELGAIIEGVMGSSLGTVTVEEPLQSFPLKLQIARQFVASRLALIGDAAHVIHPLAGQGLNLGLKDVAALGETVVEAMRLGLDHGAAGPLEDYQRWRRLDTSLMAAATDNLNRLFSNDVAPLRALRDLGLGVVDRLPRVKSSLIARAAGLEGSGPRLTRGLPL